MPGSRHQTPDTVDDRVRDLPPRQQHQYQSGPPPQSRGHNQPPRRDNRRDERRRMTDEEDTVLDSQDVSSVDRGETQEPRECGLNEISSRNVGVRTHMNTVSNEWVLKECDLKSQCRAWKDPGRDDEGAGGGRGHVARHLPARMWMRKVRHFGEVGGEERHSYSVCDKSRRLGRVSTQLATHKPPHLSKQQNKGQGGGVAPGPSDQSAFTSKEGTPAIEGPSKGPREQQKPRNQRPPTSKRSEGKPKEAMVNGTSA
uniref:Uncharacterized protein n=1 Tax=Timema cristinae TaxID=61476 RepID=A0A7R9CS33_TIMCR|nr:unnamed protein product [Timema cristinae]